MLSKIIKIEFQTSFGICIEKLKLKMECTNSSFKWMEYFQQSMKYLLKILNI